MIHHRHLSTSLAAGKLSQAGIPAQTERSPQAQPKSYPLSSWSFQLAENLIAVCVIRPEVQAKPFYSSSSALQELWLCTIILSPPNLSSK